MAPVSGSKKTKILGINVKTINLSKIMTSSLKDLIRVFLIIWEKRQAKESFESSLGWKERPKILNQHLAPLVESPINKTKMSKKHEKR